MSLSAGQIYIQVSCEVEPDQPPVATESTLMSLGGMMQDYHGTFGEVPRCIKGALQVLLTKGKVKIQFGNGMSERIELNDYKDLASVGEAIRILNEFEARLSGAGNAAARPPE